MKTEPCPECGDPRSVPTTHDGRPDWDCPTCNRGTMTTGETIDTGGGSTALAVWGRDHYALITDASEEREGQAPCADTVRVVIQVYAGTKATVDAAGMVGGVEPTDDLETDWIGDETLSMVSVSVGADR